MKIHLLRKTEYHNRLIFIMQFDIVFQYLFADDKGQIYQDHISIRPTFWNHIKYRLRLIPVPFTKDEMTKAEEIVVSGAIKSIDKMIEYKSFRPKKEEINRRIKARNPDACMWRVLNSEDEHGNISYECLTHKVTIIAEEGQKPYHDPIKK